MDVEKQTMVLQDRVPDLKRHGSAFNDNMTGPESDESARPKLSGKQKLPIAIALIAASAVLVATTVMLALFGFEADRAYYNATGKPMSPDQRLVVDILGGTYFALYFIIIFISTHYHLTKHSLARLFWGFNLMSLTFMAFVEVVHYSIAFLAAEQAGKLGANI